MTNLEAAGLSETEAKAYTALLSRPDWQPSVLAQFVGETRTNTYKILDRLVELGLADRYDKAKKLHYRAANPSRLIELAQELRESRIAAEQDLELNVQHLTQEYVKANEQPGVRFYQGEEAIGDIFKQVAGAHEDVLFVHTTAGADFYSFKTMHNLRMLAVNAGVKRRALTPDNASATKDYKDTDPLVLLSRTWLKKDDYTAPVEWGVFDDKLYIISYGKEALGITIESQQIADAFKQLFTLVERGQKLLPNYRSLPQHAKAKGKTTPKL
jgi:sugar-specific transcriptional regulator TrmB